MRAESAILANLSGMFDDEDEDEGRAVLMADLMSPRWGWGSFWGRVL